MVTASIRNHLILRTATSLLMKKSLIARDLGVGTEPCRGQRSLFSFDTVSRPILSYSLQYLTRQSGAIRTDANLLICCRSFIPCNMQNDGVSIQELCPFFGESVTTLFARGRVICTFEKMAKNIHLIVSAFWGSILSLLWTSLMFS